MSPVSEGLMRRVVIVLGGNAFVNRGQRLTMEGQLQFAHDSMWQLRPLLDNHTQLLISHGNGPQVGQILIRVEEALGKAYSIPLEVCVAESEGELGYVLQLALGNVLARLQQPRSIAALLTQVVVDADDPAFRDPVKPIGVYYSQSAADELQRQGFAVSKDVAGRGYRRVVASPRPCELVGMEIILQLLQAGHIVIAAGGGGIPVVRLDEQLQGVEAVIDKDLTAAMLADQLDAELLLVLTDVPCVYREFGTAQQQPLHRLGTVEARQLIRDGQFASGSMLPKIEAAVQFCDRSGRRTIICDPPSLAAALEGGAGTLVEYDSGDGND
jgi:carbamate kinase